MLDTKLCDKDCQCFVEGLRFSPGNLVSSTNKTDPHDVSEILLKVALNNITLILTLHIVCSYSGHLHVLSVWIINM